MDLTPRQRKTSRRLFSKKGGAVWWRVGAGKTRVTYSWFAMVAKSCGVQPRFVVVCRREAFKDWMDEAKLKLGLKWRFQIVEEEDDLYRVKVDRPLVYIISHGKLAKLLPGLLDCGAVIQAVVYDEGFLYKNPQTEHANAANKLSKVVGRAAILSGSVMTARDLTDIYGQLYAINKHQVLARTLTEFRSRYLTRFAINPNNDSKAAKFVAARGSGKRIARLIKGVASIYIPSNSERRVINDIRTIPASRDQLRAFKELREFYELELKGRRLELKNAPSVITKCQQISDGFVKMEDEFIHLSSSKMAWLLSQVAELVSCGERVIVWCAFQRSVSLILQQLQKKMPSVKAYGMHGSCKFDQKGWTRNGQVAVATVGSGSSVNHFEQVPYAIYYSHSFRWLDMQQSRGRTDRKASRHQTCYYYYLHTQESLDSFVYKTVNNSRLAERRIIEEAVNQWLTKQ